MSRGAVLVLLAVAGCAPRVPMSGADRSRAARALEGQQRYLEAAAYLVPFFGDPTKLLITDQPLEELSLPASAAPQRVLAPGTAVRIQRVEFPTGWIPARRPARTPRYQPWVYLALANEPQPVILLLPQDVGSAEEARAEVDRLLGPNDPAAQLAALPEAQQLAIAHKALLEGMTPAAVEMAWGRPARKVIDRPGGTETWTWPSEKRRASFENGRLVKWEPAPGE
jgi:hypothetical protein